MTITSAWLSPWRSPTAARTSTTNASTSAATSAGSTAGNMCPDSTNAGGPATLLSVMPTTVVRPSTVTASTLTSVPVSSSSSSSRRCRGWPRVLRSRATTSRNESFTWASPSTRRTDVPALRSTGLATSG